MNVVKSSIVLLAILSATCLPRRRRLDKKNLSLGDFFSQYIGRGASNCAECKLACHNSKFSEPPQRSPFQNLVLQRCLAYCERTFATKI